MASIKSPHRKANKVRCGFCVKLKSDKRGDMIPTKCEGKRICCVCWNKRSSFYAEFPTVISRNVLAVTRKGVR